MSDMNSEIISLIKSRMEKGKIQYGHGLLPDSGYVWVQEALEEALDLAIYVSAKLVEVKAREKDVASTSELSKSF